MSNLLNLWFGTGLIDENYNWTLKALRIAARTNPQGLAPVELARQLAERI